MINWRNYVKHKQEKTKAQFQPALDLDVYNILEHEYM